MIEQGGRGGVADYTGELVRALAAEGWSVALATADDHLYGEIDGVVVHPVFHYVRDGTRAGRALRARGLGPVANGACFLRLAAAPDAVGDARGHRAHAGLGDTRDRSAGDRLHAHARCDDRADTARHRRAIGQAAADAAADHVGERTPDRGPRSCTRCADLALLPAGVRERAAVIAHGEYGGLARTGGAAEREASRAALGIAPGAR